MRAAPRIDEAAFLVTWAVLLFGISAIQVVAPLGAIGPPATILSFLAFAWWMATRLFALAPQRRGLQPVQVVLWLYVAHSLASYALGHLRLLTPLERSGADRGLLTVLGLVGIALVANEIRRLERLEWLLRVVVGLAAAFALYGIVQSLTGHEFAVSIPGLTFNAPPDGIGERSLFRRPQATALHPIEFGVVLGMVLPLAIHLVLTEQPGRRRQAAIAALVVIGVGAPLSISRSALVAIAAAMLVYLPGLPWRHRVNVVVVGSVATVGMYFAVPGLLGTFRSMFTNTANDPSIQGRLERIPRIAELFREYPWLGRGVGTYSVEDYFILDNQLYYSAIEVGIVGLAVLAVVFGVAIFLGIAVGQDPSRSLAERSMARALAATVFAAVASMATFDAFFYRILTGLLFLAIGMLGALHGMSMTKGPIGTDQ